MVCNQMSVAIVVLLYILWKYYGGSFYCLLPYANKVLPKSVSVWYSTDLDWCAVLRRYYQVIRQEYLQYITHYDAPAFGDVDDIQKHLSLGPNDWKVVILR